MTSAGPGSIVRVRSRQYLVEEVVPPSQPGEDTCLRLSCLDDDAQGQEIQVLWESEVDAQVLTASSWGAAAQKGFDAPRRFAAWLHTQRWNCVTATDPRLLQSPWRAGIEVMAYQLEPLRKALLLPRVNLFIADDVGLGKTIEAGLIVRELLLRQRVRRTVVACPASVVWQWKNELEARFGLSFAVVDRDFVRRCRRERGYGINPWKTHNAFVISHNLLRDEDYAAPLRDWMEDKRPFTGSLLILDEAHNAAPASGSKYAIDSKLTQVVRDLTQHFEHRLFLSATPHNGHSNSFSALLEMLDPQRFCRGVPVKSALLDDVMVRRLKSDLAQAKAGRFPKRHVVQLDLEGLPESSAELRLPELLERYRTLREQTLTATKANRTQLAAGLLITISLQKRLLSSVEAFARTLGVHRKALQRKAAAPAPASALPSFELLREAPGADDEDLAQLTPQQLAETEDAQTMTATSLAGAVTAAEQKLLDEMGQLAEEARHQPDAKVLRLVEWLKTNCCPGGKWNERRVLVFTEYVDTLRILRRHLEELLPDVEERIDVLEGGAVLSKRREALKEAFNAHPWENPLRVLIATDAAREGVNLQNHCADLFHFDVPWNPGRMEQRNGRIDRKHQREDDVRCHYFVYGQRPEDRVLQVLVQKSKTIQQELGSLSQVVDTKLSRRLAGGIRRAAIDDLRLAIQNEAPGDERKVVEEELEAARRTTRLEEQLYGLRGMLEVSRDHLGFSSEALRLALDESLAVIDAPSLGLLGAGPNGREMWQFPDLLDVKHAGPGWLESLDTLRKPRKPEEKLWDWRRANAPRPVVFEDVGALDDDTVHLHLEQKLVQRLLGRFLSQGFAHEELSRVCAILTPHSVAKVVLVGRLSLHGVGAARLHDELVHVTAPWLDAAKRTDGLKPYRATAEALTLEELDAQLCREDVRAPAQEVLERLRGTLVRDVASLEPELHLRGEAAEQAARVALADRAAREARSLRQLLEAQQKRIRDTLGKANQQAMQFSDEERRQAAAEHAHQKKRLTEIDRELVDEPKRLEGTWGVHARRLEVLGVVYLWPAKG